MGDNVKSLFGGPVGVPEPDDNAISVLEDALERARSGDVCGVALVMLHSDGLSGYRLAGRLGGYSVLGALAVVQAELVEIVRE